jgi:uncharacterized protein (TIGR02271 family)
MENYLLVNHERASDPMKDVTFKIKEEQLDIAKQWLQTADVKVYRETLTQQKSFSIPIKREELVIEHTLLSSQKNVPPEVIRILLSEEQVNFTKNMLFIEDVSIYKEQIEDIKHIEAILKREEPRIKFT